MEVQVLLDTLASIGVEVTLSAAGKVRVHPASRVPAELLDSLKEQREHIQLYLQVGTNPANPQPRKTADEDCQTREKSASGFAGINPASPQNIPAVSEKVLALRLGRGQRASGHYHFEDWAETEGVCFTCTHWQQSGPGKYGGLCRIGDQYERQFAHRCDLERWKARA